MSDPKFTLNIQSDGKMSLTLRTDDSDELQQLMDKWQELIVVSPQKREKSKPVKKENSDKPNGKFKLSDGDDCPNCNGELIRRSGAKGKFLGCTNYPDCTFTQGF